ncbi:MAG: hypothetical protein N2C14_15335, partial [Planctomycetales bacterium]
DGDFPREVLASRNLTFAEYRMPTARNTPAAYDAKIKGPTGQKSGVLKLGALEPKQPAAQQAALPANWPWAWLALVGGVFGLLLLKGSSLRDVLRD